MDGTAIIFAVIQVLITALCVVGPVAVMFGRLTERVKQIEKRLDGNGESLPARCVRHSTELEHFDRRLNRLEPTGK